jgi:hypothetical protein
MKLNHKENTEKKGTTHPKAYIFAIQLGFVQGTIWGNRTLNQAACSSARAVASSGVGSFNDLSPWK